MYKVFIKDKPLILSSDLKPRQESDQANLNEKNLSITEVEDLLEREEELHISGDPNLLLHSLFSGYKWIVAAGGVVRNQDNKILFIERNGLWDLPKGKLEKGESVELCAVREVEEECGISGLEIVSELSSTFHTYEHKGKQVLKRTYWYEMKTEFSGQLIPQEEEGITKVEWLGIDELDKVRNNTFKSILELLNGAV